METRKLWELFELADDFLNFRGYFLSVFFFNFQITRFLIRANKPARTPFDYNIGG